MGSSRILFKVLSVGLALATGLQGVVWAGSEQVALAVPVATEAVGSAGPEVRFVLPAAVGVVQDGYSGRLPRGAFGAPRNDVGGDKLIVLIQDAHTNESGQMNVARALERILTAEDIHLLFTEGADSDVTPDVLKIGDQALREKVGQAFLRKGLLSGGEYLSMTSDRDFRIVGVEDLSLYHQAGRMFRDAADGRRAALLWLDRVARVLNTLKSDLWTRELRSLDAQRERYRSGELPLTDYFDQLAASARANGIPLTAYPNLNSLLELRSRENRIDFKRAGEEEAQAIKTLPQGTREELMGLQKTYSPFKRSGSSEDGSDGFFTALQAALIAADAGAAAKFAALFEYFSYINDSRRLNTAGVLKELDGLEAAVWDAMGPALEARQLELLLASVGRMQRITRLQATPDDFDAYTRAAAAHDPKVIAGWANRRIADLKKHYDQAVSLDHRFDAPFASAVGFYQINARRDEVMVDRMLERMDADGAERAAIVTGGFHTPNLERLLRARGVSYVTVLPQILYPTDTNRYERLVREAVDEIGAEEPAQDSDRIDTRIAGPAVGAAAIVGGWMLPPVGSRLAVLDAIESSLKGSAAIKSVAQQTNPDTRPDASAARMATVEGDITHFVLDFEQNPPGSDSEAQIVLGSDVSVPSPFEDIQLIEQETDDDNPILSITVRHRIDLKRVASVALYDDSAIGPDSVPYAKLLRPIGDDAHSREYAASLLELLRSPAAIESRIELSDPDVSKRGRFLWGKVIHADLQQANERPVLDVKMQQRFHVDDAAGFIVNGPVRDNFGGSSPMRLGRTVNIVLQKGPAFARLFEVGSMPDNGSALIKMRILEDRQNWHGGQLEVVEPDLRPTSSGPGKPRTINLYFFKENATLTLPSGVRIMWLGHLSARSQRFTIFPPATPPERAQAGARMALPAPVNLPAALTAINGYYETFESTRASAGSGAALVPPVYEFLADLGPASSVTEQQLFAVPGAQVGGTLPERYEFLMGHIEAARAVFGWMNDLGANGVFAKDRSDAGATAAIRRAWKRLSNDTVVRSVVSEGERDFADAVGVQEHHAMIAIGEEIPGQRPVSGSMTPKFRFDAALDVLEVTNAVSSDAFLGAASVGTYASRDALKGFPDYYLSKWAVGPAAAGADLSFDVSPGENLQRIAAASGKRIADLKGSVLFRPAHIRLIAELVKAGINADDDTHLKNLVKLSDAYEAVSDRSSAEGVTKLEVLKTAFNQIKARLKKSGYLRLGNLTLLADGDLLPAVALGLPNNAETHLDFLVGRGGTSEGVMAASAVKAIGGKMIATLVSHDQLSEDAFGADLQRDGKKFSVEELERLGREFGLYPAGDTRAAGQDDLSTVYTLPDLIRTNDFVFVATAVKPHALIPGLMTPALSENGQTFTTTSLWVSPGSVRLITVTQKTQIAEIAGRILDLKKQIMDAYKLGDRSAINGLKNNLASAYHNLGRTYLFFQRFGEAQYYLSRAIQNHLEIADEVGGVAGAGVTQEIVSERAALLHAKAIQVLQTGAHDSGIPIVSPAAAALDLLESALNLKPVQVDARLRTDQLHSQLAEYLGDEAASKAETAEADVDKLTELEKAVGYYKRGADRDSLGSLPPSRKYRETLESIRALRQILDQTAGARLADQSRRSTASTSTPARLDLLPAPRVIPRVGRTALRGLRLFAAAVILAGVAEGAELPVDVNRGRDLAVLNFSKITPTSAEVGIGGGLTETIQLEDAKAVRAEQRAAGDQQERIAPAVQKAVELRAADRAAAVDAIAGFGWIDAYYRIPLGFIFPEEIKDSETGEMKPNLTNEQIRAQISLLLTDVAAFSGRRENGRRITFYLDPENLNPANRAWLKNVVAKMPDLHILSEKDLPPQGMIGFNWYVDKGHKDWRTDEDPNRHPVMGSHLLVKAMIPGVGPRWSRAIEAPIRAFFAAVPDAGTSAPAQNAGVFLNATSFRDARFWQDHKRWFYPGAVFAGSADMLVRFQGAELFLPSQVADYILFKDINEWADFVRQARKRTSTAA